MAKWMATLDEHHYGRNLPSRQQESRIRKALRGANLTFDDEQMDFRDADQIAAWTVR